MLSWGGDKIASSRGHAEVYESQLLQYFQKTHFFLHLHLVMKEIFFLPHAKSITAIHVFLHIVLFLGFEMSPNGGPCKLVGTVLQWVLKPELVPSESK